MQIPWKEIISNAELNCGVAHRIPLAVCKKIEIDRLKHPRECMRIVLWRAELWACIAALCGTECAVIGIQIGNGADPGLKVVDIFGVVLSV